MHPEISTNTFWSRHVVFLTGCHCLTQHLLHLCCMSRVGQNRIYTPYMTVYLMISLPKIPYIHRIYMVLANPMYEHSAFSDLGWAGGLNCGRYPPLHVQLRCSLSLQWVLQPSTQPTVYIYAGSNFTAIRGSLCLHLGLCVLRAFIIVTKPSLPCVQCQMKTANTVKQTVWVLLPAIS